MDAIKRKELVEKIRVAMEDLNYDGSLKVVKTEDGYDLVTENGDVIVKGKVIETE